jgi:hypothetical protein
MDYAVLALIVELALIVVPYQHCNALQQKGVVAPRINHCVAAL